MALVLEREAGETLVLFTGADEQIVVTIEAVKGRKVKVSIEAPKSVDIWRDELLEPEEP